MIIGAFESIEPIKPLDVKTLNVTVPVVYLMFGRMSATYNGASTDVGIRLILRVNGADVVVDDHFDRAADSREFFMHAVYPHYWYPGDADPTFGFGIQKLGTGGPSLVLGGLSGQVHAVLSLS